MAEQESIESADANEASEVHESSETDDFRPVRLAATERLMKLHERLSLCFRLALEKIESLGQFGDARSFRPSPSSSPILSTRLSPEFQHGWSLLGVILQSALAATPRQAVPAVPGR